MSREYRSDLVYLDWARSRIVTPKNLTVRPGEIYEIDIDLSTKEAIFTVTSEFDIAELQEDLKNKILDNVSHSTSGIQDSNYVAVNMKELAEYIQRHLISDDPLYPVK